MFDFGALSVHRRGEIWCRGVDAGSKKNVISTTRFTTIAVIPAWRNTSTVYRNDLDKVIMYPELWPDDASVRPWVFKAKRSEHGQ